jgi:SAM-dependent methyltransferase
MEHLGGYFEDGDINTYTPDIWGWLLMQYDIKSVLDVGCGTGVNMRWFKNMGCDVVGIEGCPDAIARRKCSPIIQHDYTKGPLRMDGEFDLCISTEFVEHVEQQYEENWFSSMQSAQRILMSHAIPGQGGYHHVNEQTGIYWIRRFSEYGYVCCLDISRRMRATVARVPAPWGRNTLMLFKRR